MIVRPISIERLRGPKAAVLGLVAFVGGMVVAPLGHLVGHRDDHVHLPGGGIEASPRDACEHAHEPEPPRRRGFVHSWEREREAERAREHAAAHARCERAVRAEHHHADHAHDDHHDDHAHDDLAGHDDHAHGDHAHAAHHGDRAPAPGKRGAHHGQGALEHFGVALVASCTFFFLPLDRTPVEPLPGFGPSDVPAERWPIGSCPARGPPA